MKKLFRFLVPLLLIVLIVASIGWYLFVYDRNFTRDMLLSQARYNDLYGNSRLSSWFYDMAYEYSDRDENVAIELANQYKADENYTKAEVTLTNAIKNNGTIELYTALCKTYAEQDKLLDAVTLLDNIDDPSMKQALDAMRPSAPVANHPSGYYSEYIDVTLSSSAGTVYYTMDGEYPSIKGSTYEAPLTLEAGETVIYAISVDSSGLVSQPVILGYTVGGVIEPAVFADPTLEAAVRQTLGVTDSKILYTNDLWDITEFTIPSGTISIEDLKLMPYLKSLTIEDVALDSLAHFSGLSKLETLTLTGCSLPAEELSTLGTLPNLTSLTLSDCGLSTIAALADVPHLTKLDLSGNTLRNLEALNGMTGLKELNLQHNAVTALDSLSSLTNLEKLDISFNAITSLSPLASCTRLNWLDAGNNSLRTIKGVEGLTLLNHLSVDYNDLTDISLISSCTGLTNLSFANNKITDISALSSLINLDILDFSYNTVETLPDWQDGCVLRIIDGSQNKLKNIDNLSRLEHLSYVYMDYNEITSVNALANNYRLVQVNVYGNDIDSVSELTAHDIIVNYDPT